MAMLFPCDNILKDLKVCSPSSGITDVFCFNKPELSSLTTKIFDAFYNKYYGFSLKPGETHVMGSGGAKNRFNKNAIIWRLGTPRRDNNPHLLGGTGPEYLLKCQQSDGGSSCQFWNPGKTYPDPAPSSGHSGSIHSDWYQNPPGTIHWYLDGDKKIPDSVSLAEPDAESVYEIHHSPCLETILKNKQIIEQSSDCENLPLFKKFLDESTPKLAEPLDAPVPKPVTPPSPTPPSPTPPSPHTEPSYLQVVGVGVGVAGALLCGYKTYKEGCKYFQSKNKKPNEEAFSAKRLVIFATSIVASLAFTVYSLKA